MEEKRRSAVSEISGHCHAKKGCAAVRDCARAHYALGLIVSSRISPLCLFAGLKGNFEQRQRNGCALHTYMLAVASAEAVYVVFARPYVRDRISTQFASILHRVSLVLNRSRGHRSRMVLFTANVRVPQIAGCCRMRSILSPNRTANVSQHGSSIRAIHSAEAQSPDSARRRRICTVDHRPVDGRPTANRCDEALYGGTRRDTCDAVMHSRADEFSQSPMRSQSGLSLVPRPRQLVYVRA